jgi:hypothetical protein
LLLLKKVTIDKPHITYILDVFTTLVRDVNALGAVPGHLEYFGQSTIITIPMYASIFYLSYLPIANPDTRTQKVLPQAHQQLRVKDRPPPKSLHPCHGTPLPPHLRQDHARPLQRLQQDLKEVLSPPLISLVLL